MPGALQAGSSPADTSDTIMLECTDLLLTLENGYVLPTRSGRYRRSGVSQLSAEYDHCWAQEPLPMQLVKRLGKKLLTSSEVINLSQVANASSAIVHCDTSFVEQMARMLNYSHKFLEDYGLPLLTEKMADTV